MVQNPMRKRGSKEVLKPFEISGVYLLNTNGIVIFHKDISFHKEFDADIFGSMLTAIKIYIEGSLRSNSELRDIDYGQFKILIEQGNEFFLVVMGKGDAIEPVREDMGRVIEDINERYGEVIADWSGDVEAFDGIEKEFEILTGAFGYRRGYEDKVLRVNTMAKNAEKMEDISEEIKIPMDFVEKIDRVVGTDMSKYSSREEFIKSAVEIKLRGLRGPSPE